MFVFDEKNGRQEQKNLSKMTRSEKNENCKSEKLFIFSVFEGVCEIFSYLQC
jgi:hypothetical protein